jgi:MFS transporter, DHA1 family, inner membrane transport protein
MKRNEWLILLILAGLNFTHILDFMIMMPLGNYLMPYFNISAREFSILVAAYTLSAGLSGFAAAFFVDRYDRKKILLLGFCGFLLGTIACGFAPSYPLLLASRTLAGIFGGLIGAQVLSIVSDVFGYERRGLAMGAIMSSFAVASVLGVPIALYFANEFSWQAPFIFVGIVGIVILPLIIFFLPSMTQHIQHDKPRADFRTTLSGVLNHQQQRNALIFSALIMLGHFLIIPFVNPYMELNVGYTKEQTPWFYFIGGLAAFISAAILGKLADKYGKMTIFSISIILSLVTVWTITNLPAIPFSITLAIFAVWFILSTGRMVSANAMISNVVQSEHRGSFMSFNSSVQQLGTALASLVAGLVIIKGSDNKIHHYDWLGYLSIVILVVALFMARKLFGQMDKVAVK